jgi:hypothetical protein
MKPLCFILMPLGRKANPAGGTVDFDSVYNELVQPAVEAAELEPLRAGEEITGGIIHKPMLEQLVLCPYAVADLTLANADIFYQLGVRHAFRPSGTASIMAGDSRLPFDVQMLQAIRYRLGPDGRPDPSRLDKVKDAISGLLQAASIGIGAEDSSLFQLVEENTPAMVAHEKTDVFPSQVDYSMEMKSKLAAARKEGKSEVAAIDRSLGDVAQVESGVVIDLLLAYRDAKAWQEMVDLVPRMALPLGQTLMVQEQRALALNRLERHDEAEEILNRLIATRGPSSETSALLGRVYKDRWDKANKASKTEDAFAARSYLEKAIAAYTAGFEADWRDTLPGINAVTLMEIKDPPDDRRLTMVPVVRYSVERKVANGRGDYWDYATLVELAVLAKDETKAKDAFSKALSCIRASWEVESTARNLRLIREARERRGGTSAWAREIEDELRKRAGLPGS